MDDFARRPADDRRAYIEEAAAIGISRRSSSRRILGLLDAAASGSSCWACRSYDLQGRHVALKAYDIIQRFSEDIDLTISRSAPILSTVASPMEADQR
jgi:hypothetical protein